MARSSPREGRVLRTRDDASSGSCPAYSRASGSILVSFEKAVIHRCHATGFGRISHRGPCAVPFRGVAQRFIEREGRAPAEDLVALSNGKRLELKRFLPGSSAAPHHTTSPDLADLSGQHRV